MKNSLKVGEITVMFVGLKDSSLALHLAQGTEL